MPLPLALNSLYVFHTAAQQVSFSQAATQLEVTHGAVSRQIDQLERDLGVRLFHRSRRGISLTQEGRLLFTTTGEVFALLDEAVTRLRHIRLQPLVVSCERSLAMKWLIPRLSAFQDAHPSITIHLSTGGGSVDFRREGIDLAIRRADFPLDPAWHITPLMHEFMGPVCTPQQLVAFQQGHFTHLFTSTRPGAWKDWYRLSGNRSVNGAEQVFDHFFLLLQAAISGLGVAVVPYAIALDALVTGQLLAPCGFVADGSRYCIISPVPVEAESSAAVFMGWLTTIAAELEATVPLVLSAISHDSPL
jgi:DNA-binding transcriptional LysR family regulator